MMRFHICWLTLGLMLGVPVLSQDVRVSMGRFDLAASEAAAAMVALDVRYTGESSLGGLDGGLTEKHRLRVANRSSSAILMVVYKHACVRPGGDGEEAAWDDCGTSKTFFHMGASPGHQPIAPGSVRDLNLAVSTGRSSEVRIVPICILFEDGSSIGKREPYVSGYLEMLKPMADHFESLTSVERAKLEEERRIRLERIRDMANAIAARSFQLEADAAIPPKKN